MFGMEFYVDPSRCIGCQACLKACEDATPTVACR
jgi:Fe-S-cluster-containing dehydrogenase component